MYKKLVITHDNCVDGCCSQLIFKNLFGDKADYVAVDHADYDPKFKTRFEAFKEKVQDVKDTEVYMADICLPPEWIEHFLNQNNKVVILDHHKTSIPFVEPFEKRLAEGENLNMEIVFSKENKESGAMLAWNYVNPGKEAPNVVKYICDGDRWEFKHNETKAFYAKLLTFGSPNESVDILDNLLFKASKSELKEFVEEGREIHEDYMNKVKSYMDYARPIKLFGREGSIVQAPAEYKSDLGNLIAQKNGGFALIIDDEDGIVKCSLRSISPVIVSDIAKKLSGGGHDQAAAFRLNSYEELNAILKENGNNLNFEVQRKNKPKV